MAAPAHRERNAVLAREGDGGDDVVGTGGARDELGRPDFIRSWPAMGKRRGLRTIEYRTVGVSPMSITKSLVAAFLTAASAGALSADAWERGFIRRGMAEGEVVFRIGRPDHEAFIQNIKGHPEEKTWTYFPHGRDPQTLTIITLRAGVVADIERKIAR